jgi:hypothetical protein
VVLRWGFRRGTFLPQVWESLPEPRDFLRNLKRKAGLPESFWDDGVVLERYTVEKFEEPPRLGWRPLESHELPDPHARN